MGVDPMMQCATEGEQYTFADAEKHFEAIGAELAASFEVLRHSLALQNTEWFPHSLTDWLCD